MNPINKPRLICKILLVLTIMSQSAIAQGALTLTSASSVILGMGYGDVLELWGAPDEKVEQEAKRIDVWRYDKQLVYFKEGKVIKTEDKLDLAILPLQEVKDPVAPKPKLNEPNAAQMEKILSEIIGSTNR